MSEYGISYEGTPCNIEFLEMVKDYDLHEGMLKYSLDLCTPSFGQCRPSSQHSRKDSKVY